MKFFFLCEITVPGGRKCTSFWAPMKTTKHALCFYPKNLEITKYLGCGATVEV